MADTAQARVAWEPLTPPGVAAFAMAPTGRLFLVETFLAAFVAAIAMWFAHDVWFPIVREAIGRLPSQGVIQQGKLAWRGDSPAQLAGDRFLAIVVDLYHEGAVGREADLSVEFGLQDCRIFSLFGFATVNYPANRTIGFNRAELEPWWGAREPFILIGLGIFVVLTLIVFWALFGAVHLPVAMLVAFFADRQISLAGSWRLASAAILPGTLAFAGALFFYGANVLDFIRLCIIGVGQFVIGWIYLVASPLFLPRHPAARSFKGNPFVTSAKPPNKPV